MNIDRYNFSRIFPILSEELRKCDLVAFDLEYSGIRLSEQSGYNLFDTMEQRYQHVKSCAQSFTTFQLGIVLFTRVINDRSIIGINSKFLTKTYNINLFPTGSDLFDTNFNCSAAALKFLRTNHMDINDIIDKGVGFLNKEEFNQLKSKLDSYSNVQGILSEEQQRMLDSQRRTISEWLTKTNDQIIEISLIDRFSPYFQQMYFRSHFTGISTKFENDCIIVEKVDAITRFEIDQKEDCMDFSSEKYKFCMEMLGVSKIFKLISRLKKPVVGHNTLFDLITIYQKFFATLPDKFEDFKYELHKVLPTIYDTKFVFGRMRMNFKELAEIEGGLQTIFNALSIINKNSKNDGIVIEEDSDDRNYDKDRMCQAHQAGYDSFMTGCCLLYLANMLYKKDNADDSKPSGDCSNYDKLAKRPVKIGVASFETYETFLKSWKNYVNVIKAHEFCICFDPTNNDDGFLTTSGNKLLNTRPPFLIVYDRQPKHGLIPIEDAIEESCTSEPDSEATTSLESPSEIYFCQGFLEQVLFEFGHADVRKLDDSIKDERFQRFLVAMSSYNVSRAFRRSVKKKWPRLMVREYNKLSDDRWTRNIFLLMTGVSTMVSVWSMTSLIKMYRN